MSGYKGGEYYCNNQTRTWVANYGKVDGYRIIDIEEIDGNAVLVVDEVVW